VLGSRSRLRLAGLLGEDAPVAEWNRNGRRSHAACHHGVDADRGTFMRARRPGGRRSIARAPHRGVLPGDDERVVATVEGCGPSSADQLVMRYRTDDGLSGDRCLPSCSFWLARARVRRVHDEAADVFERACGARTTSVSCRRDRSVTGASSGTSQGLSTSRTGPAAGCWRISRAG
jgi:GH15 family glucan-1,4-alpha-glucosidase